ncbi:type VI secretion system membrane subunit TssM [Azospirillum sp. sgz302134]
MRPPIRPRLPFRRDTQKQTPPVNGPRRRRPNAAAAITPRLRWGATLAVALSVGLLGWSVTPLLGLTGAPVRLLPALLALVVWLLLNRREDQREAAANARLVEALAASRDPELKASLEELGTVRERLDAVLGQLKTQRFGARWGGRYLYQLPWYLVIGAPGSGKTTALANARLGAALGAGVDGMPVQNLGGTRNCDWWFTDHAVLIDTAGRYTTQDSRRAVDGRVWSGLLDLLKEHRPRQPVNGVLLTISLTDLAVWSDEERHNHAITIRQRLAELRGHLGLRVPVYLLCTKADLVDGFSTFFDPLDRGERAQVWGMTFPAQGPAQEKGAPTGQGPLAAFHAEFAALLRRLDEWIPERLHQEPDIQRRSEAFAFPLRLAEFEPALADLVDTAFAAEAEEETPLLRGIYLTSATQYGASGEDSAQTFFLERVLPDVVFPEANMVGVDRALERTRHRRDAWAVGGAVAAGLALGLFWLNSYRANSALLVSAEAAVAQAEDRIRALDSAGRSLTRVEDSDFAAVLPALDALRALPGGWTARGSWPSVAMAGGLSKGEAIGSPAEDAYRRALRSVFLSRIVLRLEEQLRTSWARRDLLRLALHAYRMIGGEEAMNPPFLAEWLAADWQRTLAGPAHEDRRRALGDHLAALFEVGFAPVPMDEALVARVVEVLSQPQPTGQPSPAPGGSSATPPSPPSTSPASTAP